MTEDEAKTKWCPFVRMRNPNLNGSSYNRDHGDSFALGCCLASACMAWRWSMEPNPAYVEQANVWPDTRQPQQKQPLLPGRERGFCGLASRP